MLTYNLHSTGAALVFFAGRSLRRNRETAPQKIAAFAANALDVDVLVGVRFDEPAGNLENISVERPGQTLVSSKHDHQDVFLRTLGQQWMQQLAGHRMINIDP